MERSKLTYPPPIFSDSFGHIKQKHNKNTIIQFPSFWDLELDEEQKNLQEVLLVDWHLSPEGNLEIDEF